MKLENFRRQWDSNPGTVGKASKMSRYALKKDILWSFLQDFEVETITKNHFVVTAFISLYEITKKSLKYCRFRPK